MDHPVVEEIRQLIAEKGSGSDTLITDLHVRRVGKASHSFTLSLVTQDESLTARQVKDRLPVHEELVHATIEIHRYGVDRQEPSGTVQPGA